MTLITSRTVNLSQRNQLAPVISANPVTLYAIGAIMFAVFLFHIMRCFVLVKGKKLEIQFTSRSESCQGARAVKLSSPPYVQPRISAHRNGNITSTVAICSAHCVHNSPHKNRVVKPPDGAPYPGIGLNLLMNLRFFSRIKQSRIFLDSKFGFAQSLVFSRLSSS